MKMAAFVDGEGCISIIRTEAGRRGSSLSKSPQFALHLHMGNIDPRLALWCSERFGGLLYLRPLSEANENHRDMYLWMAQSKRAEAVLRGCLPHFVLKREQAEIALAYRDIAWVATGRKRVPVETTEKREVFRLQLEQEKFRKFELIDGFKRPAA